jgi:hypothetical protein
MRRQKSDYYPQARKMPILLFQSEQAEEGKVSLMLKEGIQQ